MDALPKKMFSPEGQAKAYDGVFNNLNHAQAYLNRTVGSLQEVRETNVTLNAQEEIKDVLKKVRSIFNNLHEEETAA